MARSGEVRAYGEWESAVRAADVANASDGIYDLDFDRDQLVWAERRANENGRHVVVRYREDSVREDLSPPDVDVHSTVQEYGGRDWAVDSGVLWYCDRRDQRLYRMDPGAAPIPLTPGRRLRFADPIHDRRRDLIFCVQEDHTESDLECINSLVALDATRGGEPRTVASGHAFYSSPRLSPDGITLAWLSWDYPQMPWDGCELWTAAVREDGALQGPRRIAGSANESVFDPKWSAEGILHFVSDRSGWWNLYAVRDATPVPLCPRESEFGVPQWSFGLSTYDFLPDGRIAAAYIEDGRWNLGVLNGEGSLQRADTPYSEITYVRTNAGRVYFVGANHATPPSIICFDPGDGTATSLYGSALRVAESELSVPVRIDFPTGDGFTGHALFYPPHSSRFQAPEDELPPLLVDVHGGPTGRADLEFEPELQYFATRGFAVAALDHRGSTGYGRPYREALKGKWGIADVEDAINLAKWLVEHGKADARRVAIRGGSAGGYTTLAALAFADFFSAGASYYGIADAELAREESHKFESRYDTVLYGGPELLRERSPIHAADRITAPLLILQGLEDTIVLPDQAEIMADALRRRGVPFAHLTFPGEGHGFRAAASIVRAVEAELYFYSRIWGFEPAQALPRIPIENLPDGG